MLTRQELAKDLRAQNGGASYICAADVGRYFGLKHQATRTFLRGVEYMAVGNKKLYHVLDVAQRREDMKSVG